MKRELSLKSSVGSSHLFFSYKDKNYGSQFRGIDVEDAKRRLEELRTSKGQIGIQTQEEKIDPK